MRPGELWVRLRNPASKNKAEERQRGILDINLGPPREHLRASPTCVPCTIYTYHTHTNEKKWKKEICYPCHFGLTMARAQTLLCGAIVATKPGLCASSLTRFPRNIFYFILAAVKFRNPPSPRPLLPFSGKESNS